MKINYGPKPNPELFKKLLAILDYCYQPTKAVKIGMNDSALARALGVSRPTIYRMRQSPPDWMWWPAVLREAIAHILPYLPVYKRRNVAKMMRNMPEEVYEQVMKACEARDYVIEMLKDGPALSSELLATANRGNISEARIKKAARQLGVIKEREGKVGKNHGSVWSLPTMDDMDTVWD